MAGIACLGVIVADIVGVPIDALPRRGTLELIERIELHIGGNAANTAASLGKLGERVVLVGSVGDDRLGDFLLGQLSAAGVDVRGVARHSERPSSASLVAVHSDAQRSFMHAAGANATLAATDIDWESLDGCTVFHVAGLQLLLALEGEPIASVLAEAKRRGMTTVLDTVMNPRSAGWDGLAPALPHLDWFVPSIDEAAQLCAAADPHEQIARFRRAGATNIVIKLGADGCLVAPIGRDAEIIAPFPARVVDTLGAGDAWCAGFTAGLALGRDPQAAARLGNAAGAACIEALGATVGIPKRSELEQRFGVGR